MTFEELQINLNLVFDKEDKMKILENAVVSRCKEGYFFVDDEGECYLFDEYGNLNNVKKIKFLKESYIRRDIKKIKIPDSVTSIGNGLFYDCKNLTSVTIGNNVISIGRYTFSYCSGLTSVTIPDSVTSIGDYVFAYCSSLTSVTIPNNVTKIGAWMFEGCSSLKKLIFKGKTLKQIKSMNYYPFGIKNKSIIKVE